MILSRFVKKQLYISAAILIAYGVYFLISYERGSSKVGMIGGEEAMNLSSQVLELTWEVLVVDPKYRELLWEKYRQSSLEEKEKAFVAIVRMMGSISDEQAKHLVEQLIQKSASSTKRGHRLKLFELFEKLARKFELVRPVLSHFAASHLKEEDISVTKKIEINNMMNNISSSIKDTPYKYCMEGGKERVEACSLQLANEQSNRANQYLQQYMNQNTSPEIKRAVLLSILKAKNSIAVSYINGLLRSESEEDISIALKTIKTFKIKSVRSTLYNLKSRLQNDELRGELDATLQLLENL